MQTSADSRVLKIFLNLNECLKYDILNIVSDPDSGSSARLLTALFLTAGKQAGFNVNSGNFEVEINLCAGGGTLIFKRISEKVKVKPLCTAFRFEKSEDMLDCIKALYKSNPVSASLYFFENKYFLFFGSNKKASFICKEFAKRVNFSKTKAVLSKSRLIEPNAVRVIGEKLKRINY